MYNRSVPSSTSRKYSQSSIKGKSRQSKSPSFLDKYYHEALPIQQKILWKFTEVWNIIWSSKVGWMTFIFFRLWATSHENRADRAWSRLVSRAGSWGFEVRKHNVPSKWRHHARWTPIRLLSLLPVKQANQVPGLEACQCIRTWIQVTLGTQGDTSRMEYKGRRESISSEITSEKCVS